MIENGAERLWMKLVLFLRQYREGMESGRGGFGGGFAGGGFGGGRGGRGGRGGFGDDRFGGGPRAPYLPPLTPARGSTNGRTAQRRRSTIDWFFLAMAQHHSKDAKQQATAPASLARGVEQILRREVEAELKKPAVTAKQLCGSGCP
jgi:hypothetical protein